MKRSHWGDKGEPGPDRERTSVKVEDLMAKQVVTVTRHQTAARARELMTKHRIHSIPVIDPEGEPVGIITSTDLIEGVDNTTKLGLIMTKGVMRVSQYAPPNVAAHLMRKHRIHHLVVTNDQRVTGIISSFDLLVLLEDARFAQRATAPPKKSTWEKRKEKKKKKGEDKPES